MNSLKNYITSKLAETKNQSRYRSLRETVRSEGTYTTRDGKKYISFSCNDYLGLSHHPQVLQAATEALKTYGAGAGASRLVTGNHPLYTKLEALLAEIKGTESACVFGSGYLANIGIIPALMGKNDLIIADKLVHACLLDGSVLSGAKLLRFSHNDSDHCQTLLEKHRKKYQHTLIITDHVFSMDGDIAPMPALYELAANYDAWLMTDDAHGIGIIDTPSPKPHLQMGTLSKAIGSYGGYLCADHQTIDYIRNTARSLIYSTGLPPATVAASIAALEIIKDSPELCKKPLQNAQIFTKLIGQKKAESPIVAFIIGKDEDALAASGKLEAQGFLVSAIRPPTVPEGTARLRFTFSAAHNEEDIRRLAEAVLAL